MRAPLLTTAVALAVAIAAAPLLSAQQPKPIPSGPTFRAATELVALSVTVTDAQDRFIKGLSKTDFAVFEDGVPQEVTFFASSDVPVDLAIMIDTSASMADKMAFVREAATRFVRTLGPADRAEIIGFSGKAEVLAPFTNDRSALETAIESTVPHGSTALYNSVYVAVQDLSRLAKREGDVRRPAIVVLTDGDDTSSLVSFDDLLDAAKRSGVTVYTISIASKNDAKRFDDGGRRFSTREDYSLRSLSQETGGRPFFPLEVKDLNGVYQHIADELSAQYSLAYTPKLNKEGFHRLLVRVLQRDDVKLRTRTGYYATHTVRASLDSR